MGQFKAVNSAPRGGCVCNVKYDSRKPYIIIYTGDHTGRFEYTEDKDLWDTDYTEEFYGYYKAEVESWKIITQELFIIDSVGHICYNLEEAKETFRKYDKVENTIILAATKLDCWKNCFKNVYVFEEKRYNWEQWHTIVEECIKAYNCRARG